MLVSEVMSRDVEFIEGGATVTAAAELMGEIEVGALPVGDASRVEGIVTDRDILYRVVARGLDPVATLVREVVSRPVVTCAETDTVQQAMDAMATNHFRRLPVADAANQIIGWVTLTDLARHLLVGDPAIQTALQKITEPE